MAVSYIISTILFLVSGGILIVFFRYLFTFISREYLTKAKNSKLLKKTEALEKVDELTLKGDVGSAVALLKNAFHFEYGDWEGNFIENIHIHHMSALSRIVTLFDNADLRVDDLPIIEGLFVYRLELMRSYSDALKQQELLRRKIQEENSKSTGAKGNLNWASDEYKRKIVDFEDKLVTNKRTLQGKLENLFKTLLSKPGGQGEVTYH